MRRRKIGRVSRISAFFLVVWLLMPVMPTQAGNAAEISIPDATAASGGTITVPINITNTTNLGTATIWLYYDKDVVIVGSVAEGNMGTVIHACYNDEGVTRMTWYDPHGKTGNYIFAYITLHAVGNSGDTSALDLEVKELVNVFLEPLEHSVDDGWFAISVEEACDGTDTSCGPAGDCQNCNDLDGCYSYGNGCEYRDYFCVSNEAGCDYTVSNRQTDYYDDWVYYCKDDELWKYRLYHDFYCEGGECTDHTSRVDDQLVENCNDYDDWYCNGDVREYRDYYCSQGECTYTVTASENCNDYDIWVDTSDTRWVDDPEDQCMEMEEKEQEYWDYSCMGGVCTLEVTVTQWVPTGNYETKVFTLVTTVEPADAGTVEPSQGDYECCTEVTINAEETDSCWQFSHWSGDASGTTTSVAVHMDSDKSVTANFKGISCSNPSVTITSVDVTDDAAGDPDTYGVAEEAIKGFTLEANGPDGSYVFSITFETPVEGGLRLYKLPDWVEVDYTTVVGSNTTIQVELDIIGGNLDPSFVLTKRAPPSDGLPGSAIAGIAIGVCAIAVAIYFSIRKWLWKTVTD